jgi:hypothetical protein
MQQEVLKKRQQILGDEHPDTITAMSNLAIMLSQQQNVAKQRLCSWKCWP